MFTKLLIANRGEIACRIIKTARRLGIDTVAIYSSADQHAHHVMLADEAWFVGEAPTSQSYLHVEAIITAALKSGAQAIHPGYGFLSENVHFAQACQNAGITFVGPSIDAMNIMASKQLAKQLLETTSVPLIPGYHGLNQSDDYLLHEAKRIGFPVLLKAALGGGGKGMRAVHDEAHFHEALLSARREAQAYFGDDMMLLEKLVTHPRHVEIQLMADHHGQIVHIFERDCSIQRRHQKIIEEAPAPNLADSLRIELANAAIQVAHAIQYRGAGTVEFLVDNDQHFYFMEMNTRLQVEHPVTEMITGLDLVEWELRIAANEPLPCSPSAIQAKGHAIECRVYAEDPEHGFIPSMGTLQTLEEPCMPGIRIDSGVTCHDVISQHYDPMFAKIIAWGHSRQEAISRMQQALKHYHVRGVKTNLAFLQAIVAHPAFIKAQLSTDFLTQFPIEPVKPDVNLALMMAAGLDYLAHAKTNEPILTDTFGWQMHLKSQWTRHYDAQEKLYTILITPQTRHTFNLQMHEVSCTLQVHHTSHHLTLNDGTRCLRARVDVLSPETWVIYTPSGPVMVKQRTYASTLEISSSHHAAQGLTAPMPATVVAILKEKGEHVKKGESLIILEAMKMEHTLHAPHDGQLTALFCELGAQVSEGAILASLENIISMEGTLS